MTRGTSLVTTATLLLLGTGSALTQAPAAPAGMLQLASRRMRTRCWRAAGAMRPSATTTFSLIALMPGLKA
jgi:hypothetical protein